MGHPRGKKGEKPVQKKRVKKSDVEDKEIRQLEATIEAGKPASGTNPLAVTGDVSSAGYVAARNFEDLPLSQYTKVS